MSEEGKSGKQVVAVLLALALGASLIAWFGAAKFEKNRHPPSQAESASVLSEGVLYEARAGDPGVVIAKEVASGKEIWAAELGNVTSKPAITVTAEVVEVGIAGTHWMTLDRSTGEPLD